MASREKCGILDWLLATDSVSRLGVLTFSLKLPAVLGAMAALPEHVVALIVEIISGGPVSWEDAVTEGGLRIIRFYAFEEQRILATVDRTARRMVLHGTRVLLGIRRILSTSSSGAEAEEAHGKGVADGLRRGCMQ